MERFHQKYCCNLPNHHFENVRLLAIVINKTHLCSSIPPPSSRDFRVSLISACNHKIVKTLKHQPDHVLVKSTKKLTPFYFRRKMPPMCLSRVALLLVTNPSYIDQMKQGRQLLLKYLF